MDENSNTLTSFDFGASVVDSGHESILSKLYGKVKTAVSSHDDGTAGDANSSFQDLLNTANDQAGSFYEITNDDQSMNAGKTYDSADYLLLSSSKATLTDVSDLARTVTGGGKNNVSSYHPQTLTLCSRIDLDRLPSHQGLVGGPAPTLSSSGKAPPTASVVITTATAQPSATTSAASSIGGASGSSSNSSSTGSNLHGHHLPHTSSQIDTVSFSPSSSDRHFSVEEEDMKQRQAGNATITITDTSAPSPTPTHSGNSLTLPMTKSKSLDSDTQSIATNFSISNTNSLGKIMARLRGQKHDKEFWMPDEQCKECYKCRKQFTMFRRKHHCRFCGKNRLIRMTWIETHFSRKQGKSSAPNALLTSFLARYTVKKARCGYATFVTRSSTLNIPGTPPVIHRLGHLSMKHSIPPHIIMVLQTHLMQPPINL